MNMARLKQYLFVPLLVLWGISSVFVWVKPSLQHVHADGDTLTVTATTVGTDSIDVNYNKVTKNGKSSTAYVIWKQPSSGGPTKVLFLDPDNHTISKPYTEDLKINNKPGDGTWFYIVNAYENATDATSESNVITAGQSTPAITINSGSGGANPPAGGVTSPVAGSCGQAAADGKDKGGQTLAKGGQNSLFETINKPGVKEVFRWSLSLVNLITLLFLLAISLANILRIDVDTYSVKKVFIPLLMGVLLANFSWLISRFFIELATILYAAIVSGSANASAGSDLGHAGGIFFERIVREGYGLTDLCGLATGTGSTSISSGLLGAIAGTALVFVAGILILTLYLLLVARVWVITLLIVIAPLAFLCLGFPMTKNYFKKWWTMFFSWVFMAPAAFLILKLAQVAGHIGDGPNLTRYIIVTALLFYAIQVPFKMGGEWMTKWGGYVSQFKQRAAQPFKNAGAATTDWAKKGYDAQKQLLKDRGKVVLKRTPVGKLVSSGQKKFATARADIDEQLKKAQTEGEKGFVNSNKGQRYIGRLDKSTLLAEAAAAELAKSEGDAKMTMRRQDEARGNKQDKAGQENTSVAARLAKARLEHQIEELKLKKYDERIEGVERERKILENPEVRAKLEELKKARAAAQKKHEELLASDENYADKNKKLKTTAQDLENKEAELEAYTQTKKDELKKSSPHLTKSQLDKKLSQVLGSDDDYNTLLGQKNNLSSSHETLKAQVQAFTTKENDAVTDWATKLLNARIKAAEKSYEGQEARISVDDPLRENVSENTALFAQSKAGQWVNVRRARWRTHIAAHEFRDQEELENAFYTMYRGKSAKREEFARLLASSSPDQLLDPNDKEAQKKIAQTLEEVNTANSFHASAEIFATRAKELAAGEIKKQQTRFILPDMLRPQMMQERVEQHESQITIKSDQLERIKEQIRQLTEAVKANPADTLSQNALVTAQRGLNSTIQDLAKERSQLDQRKEELTDWLILKSRSHGGRIESLQRHEQEQYEYAYQKNADGTIAKDANGAPIYLLQSNPDGSTTRIWKVKPPEQRRIYDRQKGMLAAPLREKVDGRAKNRSQPDVTREMHARGNDVKNSKLMVAIRRGDQKTISRVRLDPKQGQGDIEKARSFEGAGIMQAKDRNRGTDMAAEFVDLLPAGGDPTDLENYWAEPDILERTAVTMSKALKTSTRPGDREMVNQLHDNIIANMENAKFAEVYEVERDSSGKMLLNDDSTPKYILGPDGKPQISQEGMQKRQLQANKFRALMHSRLSDRNSNAGTTFMSAYESELGPIEFTSV